MPGEPQLLDQGRTLGVDLWLRHLRGREVPSVDGEKLEKLTDKAKILAFEIANFKHAYFSVAYAAFLLECEPGVARRHLAQLERAGIIKRRLMHDSRSGAQVTSDYEVLERPDSAKYDRVWLEREFPQARLDRSGPPIQIDRDKPEGQASEEKAAGGESGENTVSGGNHAERGALNQMVASPDLERDDRTQEAPPAEPRPCDSARRPPGSAAASRKDEALESPEEPSAEGAQDARPSSPSSRPLRNCRPSPLLSSELELLLRALPGGDEAFRLLQRRKLNPELAEVAARRVVDYANKKGLRAPAVQFMQLVLKDDLRAILRRQVDKANKVASPEMNTFSARVRKLKAMIAKLDLVDPRRDALNAELAQTCIEWRLHEARSKRVA